MEAIVIKPFHTSADATPSNARVAPSVDPDHPTLVDIPSWAFRRHAALGNCMSLEEYDARREVELETKRALAELDAAGVEINRRAMKRAEKIALDEEISSLEELDKSELLRLARDHKIGLSKIGNEKSIRTKLRAELKRKAADLDAPDPEPEGPDAELPPITIDED